MPSPTKAHDPVSIAQRILVLRGQRVLLDTDLAELYGVRTKDVNQAVRRNEERFPDDFCFRINQIEKSEVVTICDHLSRLKFSKAMPRAFTEYGAIMVATVLNSPRAVEMSVYVVRAFVKAAGCPVLELQNSPASSMHWKNRSRHWMPGHAVSSKKSTLRFERSWCQRQSRRDQSVLQPIWMKIGE